MSPEKARPTHEAPNEIASSHGSTACSGLPYTVDLVLSPVGVVGIAQQRERAELREGRDRLPPDEAAHGHGLGGVALGVEHRSTLSTFRGEHRRLLLAIPVLGRVLARLEWWGRDQPLLRRFAAHLLLILRRLTPPRPAG